MFKLISNPFYSPDDTSGGGAAAPITGTSKEDMIEFMADDDEPEVIELEEGKPAKGKEKEGKEPKGKELPPDKDDESDEESDGEETEETDELEDIEKELEEPSEEQLELVTPARRRDILKKYPNLFKDFPYLEKAYYREQQFTEILPTIEDAKQAVEKSEILDRFEGDLMGGNTETILKAVRETNPQGFYKIVDDYLPTLAKVDEKAYYHVLGNVTKHTIIAMVQEAHRLGVGNDGEGKPRAGSILQNAALLLNQFVFGSSDFKPPTNLSREGKPEENTKEKEITEREQRFVKSQFDNTRNDLNTRVNNTLRNTIEANIDPRSSMTEYVKRNASRDAMDQLETLINQDTRFRALLDKLWDRAFQEGFTQESKDRIKSAYVSKAKTLLPSVIKKARIEALKGMGKRVREESDTAPDKKGPVSSGRPRSQDNRPSGKVRDAKDIPKGMSTLDFLSSD